MPRARIGKLFHLTPLVDDLAPAEYFFNSLFSPLCMMRNYAELWHRHAAIYVIGETSIEPMHCLPREPGSGLEETDVDFGNQVAPREQVAVGAGIPRSEEEEPAGLEE